MGKLLFINRAAKTWHEKNSKPSKTKRVSKVVIKNSFKGVSND